MSMRSRDLGLTSSQTSSGKIMVLGIYETEFVFLTNTYVRDALNKAFARNTSPEAYELDKVVLLMARAIAQINGAPLRLEPREVDEARKLMGLKKDEVFTATMEAELILDERFTKREVDALFEAYVAWLTEYELAAIEAVKKKQSQGASGTTSSGSDTPGDGLPTTPASTT